VWWREALPWSSDADVARVVTDIAQCVISELRSKGNLSAEGELVSADSIDEEAKRLRLDPHFLESESLT